MHTVTKRELVNRITNKLGCKQELVKKVVQKFMDEVIDELCSGNRLEFREFGVFETKDRAARRAQNPKTLQPVQVPPRRVVRFKVGRMMKLKLKGRSKTA